MGPFDDLVPAQQQRQAPPQAGPQPWITAPKRPPAQTADQARVTNTEAQRGQFDVQAGPARVQREQLGVTNDQLNAENQRLKNVQLQQQVGAGPAGSASESPAQAAGFYMRARKANEGYGPGVPPRGVIGQTLADDLPAGIVNTFTGKDRQNANAYAADFIAATLRRESGAAINPQEYTNQYTRYFPIPGDDESTIKIKSGLRQSALDALRLQAGPLGPQVDAQFQKPGQRQQGQGQKIEPVPFDPEGMADIGFNNHSEVAALPPKAMEYQGAIDAAIRAGQVKTADQIIQFGKRYGFNTDPAQAKAAEEAIARGVLPFVATPQYSKPDLTTARGPGNTTGSLVERGDAALRGAANTLTGGWADELAALGDTAFHGGTMSSNLARQRAIDGYDEQNHFPMRTAGELAGAIMLPAGRMATAADMAKSGAIYGGIYGAGSANGGIGDRFLGALGGAGAGAATSAALGAGGNMLSRFVRGKPGPIPMLVDQTTGRVNQPLESATAGQRVAAAKQFGIDLPLGAASDRTGAIVEKGLDILPPSAGVMNDGRRALAGQVDSAVEDLASRYGSARTPFAAGQAAQQGAQNWISRFEATTGKLYNAIPISDAAPTTLTNTRATLDQLTSKFQSNPALADITVSPKLLGYQQALQRGELSWKDLKDFRSMIGDDIGAERFSDSPARGDMRALYGALSQDMRASAATQGPRALQAFERANTIFAQGQDRIEGALTSILGDDAMKNPEAAAARIRTIAMSGKGGANIQQLQQIRASLAKGGEWDDVASSLIRLMGQPANSGGRDFNPQTFVQGYSDMSEPARNLLFGDRGRVELRQALDQFVGVTQRLAGTNALRNTSNTAPGWRGAGAVGTVVASILHPLGIGVPAAGAAAGNYGLAKLWTNPAFVRWATGYSKIAAAGANPAAMTSQIGRLRRIAVADPTLREPAAAVERSIVSALSGSGVDGNTNSDRNN